MQTTKLHIRTDSPKSTSKSSAQSFAHPERNVAVLGIKPGMAVADFGSGSGAYALSIAEALRGMGHVYAIDVQRDLLRRVKREATRRGYENVEVIWGNVEKPGGSKLADGNMNLVLISNLLFQLADKPGVLLEANRILKPGGRLAIIDWKGSPPAGGQGMGPRQQDVVEKEKAKGLADEAGFGFVGEFPAGAHHYGLIFRKS